MKFGYIRVSTPTQNIGRQQHIMEYEDIDRIFIDYGTGSNTDRPKLQEMLMLIREGDTVVVESISRISRNTRDLLELMEELEKKGVAFKSTKENIDTATPAGKFMLTIFGAIAQLEREYIKDRQRQGIEIAKEKGVYKGRKPRELPHFEVIYHDWKNSQLSGIEAANLLGISKSNFYDRAKKFEKENNILYNIKYK